MQPESDTPVSSALDTPLSLLEQMPRASYLKPRRLRWLWLVSGTLLITAAIAGAFWYSRHRTGEPLHQIVSRQNLKETIDVSGAVFSEQDVILKASLSAQVLQRLVSENQRVSAGTPILQLDSATYALQLQQARVNAQASLTQAQVERSSAEKALQEVLRRKQMNIDNLLNQRDKAHRNLLFQEEEYLRQVRLSQEGVISSQRLEQQKQALDQARLDLKVAEDNLASTQRDQTEVTAAKNRVNQALTAIKNARRQGDAAIQLAQDTLQKNAILAPFTGSITRWQVNRGDYLTPGTPLARFINTEDLRLVLNVNELDLPKVHLGSQVEIIFDAYPDQIYLGKVVWMSESSITDSDNAQVFPVKVWFDNREHRIRPGMSADARIAGVERRQVVAIPISSIRKKDGRYFVDVLKQGKPQETEVKLGISTLDAVEVLSGLRSGDRLVIESTPSPVSSGRR